MRLHITAFDKFNKFNMQTSWKFKTGIILIVISLFLFATLLIIPFLNIDKKAKITATTTTLVIAEIMFYSGGALLGKEIFKKYKAYFNPGNWFKKKSVTDAVAVDNSTNDK